MQNKKAESQIASPADAGSPDVSLTLKDPPHLQAGMSSVLTSLNEALPALPGHTGCETGSRMLK